MKKLLKTADFTFIIVAVVSVVVLVAGVFSIQYVLDMPPIDDSSDDDIVIPNDTYEDVINIIDDDGYFKKYYISVQDLNFSADLEDNTIDITEDSVLINGVLVMSGGYPTKFVSFYGDYMVIPFIYNDSWKGGIINYNTKNGKHEIIDKIDNKYVVVSMENFISSKEGIMLNISNVNEDKIDIDGKEQDVCSAKKHKKTKIQENVFVKYSKKKINFSKFSVISSMTLESYINVNGIC